VCVCKCVSAANMFVCSYFVCSYSYVRVFLLYLIDILDTRAGFLYLSSLQRSLEGYRVSGIWFRI
jgi:hypothetical protein